jgi:hypothetical protein
MSLILGIWDMVPHAPGMFAKSFLKHYYLGNRLKIQLLLITSEV